MATKRFERVEKLLKLWEAHVRETPGHTPLKTEGGGATYTTSPSAYRIYCCAPHCDWGYRLPDEDEDDNCPGE